MIEGTRFDDLWTPQLQKAGGEVYRIILPDLERIMREVYVYLLDVRQEQVTSDQIDRGRIKFKNILVGRFSAEYFATQGTTTRLLIEKGTDFVTYLKAYVYYHRELGICLANETVRTGQVDEDHFAALYLALQCDVAVSIDCFFQAMEEENEMVRTALLQTKTQEIGTAVNVVSSLSAQTNMLAINAAIEAARSGDAGRGFAVIAKEIQSVAKKARVATEDIGNIAHNFAQTMQTPPSH